MGCGKGFAITLGVLVGLTAIAAVVGIAFGFYELSEAEDLAKEVGTNFEEFFDQNLKPVAEDFANEELWKKAKDDLSQHVQKFGKDFWNSDGGVLVGLSVVVLLSSILSGLTLCCKNKCVRIGAIVVNAVLLIAMIALVALTWSAAPSDNVFSKSLWEDQMDSSINTWKTAADGIVKSFNENRRSDDKVVMKCDNDNCNTKIEEFLQADLSPLFDKFALTFVFVTAGLAVVNVLVCVAVGNDED